LKTVKKSLYTLLGIFLLSACQVVIENDYQSFREANLSRALYILNGSGDTLSALDCDHGTIYNNLQVVGHSNSNGIPNDIITLNNKIYVLLSGQNSIEKYDAVTLDYEGKCYLKNGFNPLNFVPVGETGFAFVTGYKSDEVVLVNLNNLRLESGFISVYTKVSLPSGAHEETKASPTDKNAIGDNKHRGVTGGAVVLDGSNSRLYLSNVRYDSKILLTESDGKLAVYNGSNVRANGYFRQGTLSIFSFDASDMDNGITDLTLIKEIDMETLFHTATGYDDYFPGDGINPQSIQVLDGRLHIICTGTNGGKIRQFTGSEYIPAGYSTGDTVPGTDPNDGIVLILDISNQDSPAYFKHLPIGGSPSAFRNSIDKDRKIVYLAGVGAIHAYGYGEDAVDNSIIRGNSNPVLKADNPSADYYSCLLYDSVEQILYASFFSDSSLIYITVSGSGENPLYGSPGSTRTGDGPGALALWNKNP